VRTWWVRMCMWKRHISPPRGESRISASYGSAISREISTKAQDSLLNPKQMEKGDKQTHSFSSSNSLMRDLPFAPMRTTHFLFFRECVRFGKQNECSEERVMRISFHDVFRGWRSALYKCSTLELSSAGWGSQIEYCTLVFNGNLVLVSRTNSAMTSLEDVRSRSNGLHGTRLTSGAQFSARYALRCAMLG